MIDITNLTEEELVELNRRVVKAIKAKRRMAAAGMASSLCIGDNVTFTGRRGEPMSGTVTKINRVKAKVRVGLSTWTVPMNMLTRV